MMMYESQIEMANYPYIDPQNDKGNGILKLIYYVASAISVGLIGQMIVSMLDDGTNVRILRLAIVVGGLFFIVTFIGLIAIYYNPGTLLTEFMTISWLLCAIAVFFRVVQEMICCIESKWINDTCLSYLIKSFIVMLGIFVCYYCFVSEIQKNKKIQLMYYPIRIFSPRKY